MAARVFLFKVTQEMRRSFCDGSSCQIYHSSANQYRSLDRTLEFCGQISKSGMRVDPRSCEPQETSYFPLRWLFSRDPYNSS